mgnify:FL=1
MSLKITVFGGNGFVGRQVVQRLARRGNLLRIANRRPESVNFLKPLGNVGQIVAVKTDVRDELSIINAVKDSDVVINLVGILREQGSQTFTKIHQEAPALIGKVSKNVGVSKVIHLSAIGADVDAPSKYWKSKGLGEKLLRDSFPESVILRPSVIFGPDDEFLNKMASLIRLLPIVPVFFDPKNLPDISFEGIFPDINFNAGQTQFQPVYVGDVADSVVAGILSDNTNGKTFELGGPSRYSYKDLMVLLLQHMELKKPFLSIPIHALQIGALFVEFVPEFFLKPLPIPPLSRDQIKMLKLDNIVTEKSLELKDLGIDATALETILPTYISNGKAGRFLPGENTNNY